MAWNPSLSLNPEFVRVLRTTLPRRRALFVAGLTVVLLAAGAWVVWNHSAPPGYVYDTYKDITHVTEYLAWLHEQQVKNFGSESYGVLTVLLFALLFVLGPALAG